MSQITVTKEFHFEAAHRLMGYQGKCVNLHGHSYKLFVTIEGGVDNENIMVVDFTEVKKCIGGYIDDVWDHTLILNSLDPLYAMLKNVCPDMRIKKMEGNPTAENMILEIFDKCEKMFVDYKPLVTVVKVRLFETETSFAEVSDV